MSPSSVDPSRFNPIPPVDSVVGDPLKEWIFLGVMSALFVVGIIVAIIWARRTKSWIPLMCMVGGVLCLYTEPMIDQHLQVWWPEHAQPDVYTAFGRGIPLMLIPILGWYFGLGVMVRWYFLRRYGERFPIWIIFGAEVMAAVLLEPPAIQLHLWVYDGFQGVRLFGYPIWWPVVGGTCGVVAGTLIYRLEPYLKGPRVLVVPVIIPMAVVATYWGVGWPMFNVINIEAAHGLVYAASAVCVIQAVVVVWVCSIATGHHAFLAERKRIKSEAQSHGAAEPLGLGGAELGQGGLVVHRLAGDP